MNDSTPAEDTSDTQSDAQRNNRGLHQRFPARSDLEPRKHGSPEGSDDPSAELQASGVGDGQDSHQRQHGILQPLPGLDTAATAVGFQREAPTPPAYEVADLQAIDPKYAEASYRISEKIVDTQNAAVTRLSSAESFAVKVGSVAWPALALIGLVLGFVGGVILGEPWSFTLLALPAVEGIQRILEKRRS